MKYRPPALKNGEKPTKARLEYEWRKRLRQEEEEHPSSSSEAQRQLRDLLRARAENNEEPLWPEALDNPEFAPTEGNIVAAKNLEPGVHFVNDNGRHET